MNGTTCLETSIEARAQPESKEFDSGDSIPVWIDSLPELL